MDVTRERISRILELREVLLSIQTGFSLVSAAVVCGVLESISGLEPSSVITDVITHVTNEEVRAKIQQAIALHEDLLTIVKRRKLQWYGHVSRSSGLAKTILQGTVKGEEDKADKGRGGKKTSGNGQAWSSASPRGQWRTGKNGEDWLQNHLWSPNDPRG